MKKLMQGRSDHDVSLEVAYWCFIGILVTLAASLVARGIEMLWPLIRRWL